MAAEKFPHKFRAALLLCLASTLIASQVVTANEAGRAAQSAYDEALRTYDSVRYSRGDNDHATLISQLERVEQLFIKADDLAAAGQSVNQDCSIFHFGVGVPIDTHRAWACALRTDDKWLQAHYYVNGGPVAVSPSKAATLLNQFVDRDSGCDPHDPGILCNLVEDVSTGKRMNLAAFCTNDVLVIKIDCERRDLERTRGHMDRIDRQIYAAQDAKGKPLYSAYLASLQAFAEAHADYAYDSVFGETKRNRFRLEARTAVLTSHLRAIEAIPSYLPKATTDALKAADRQLGVKYKETLDGWGTDKDFVKMAAQATRNIQAKLRTAQELWIKYRDAEAAFFVHALGTTFPSAAVDSDVKTRISLERIKELEKY